MLTATFLANMALYRHDVHFDVTHERAFTPSLEAQRVVRGLTTDVDLLYFYQKQNPAGRMAKRLMEIMARANPRLHLWEGWYGGSAGVEARCLAM